MQQHNDQGGSGTIYGHVYNYYRSTSPNANPPGASRRNAQASRYPLKNRLDVMRERFHRLLDAHRVPLSVVPALLDDFGVTLSALDDDRRLADLLSEDLIAFLADTFHVERAWLRGESRHATLSRPLWYKCPDAFCARVVERRAIDPQIHVRFIRDAKPQPRLRALLGQDKLDMGIIIEDEHVPIAGATFRTYERGEEHAWDYWKTRFFYKAVILFCDQAQERYGLQYSGDLLSPEAFVDLTEGTLLPVEALRDGVRGHWNPWEYASATYPSGARDSDELPKVQGLFRQLKLDAYLDPRLWAPRRPSRS